jgi:molybdopterin converting factor small subunit
MEIRVLAFARLREILGTSLLGLELPPGASVADAWGALLAEYAALGPERGSTRAAINGRIVSFDAPLSEGDELALLPPVGGG